MNSHTDKSPAAEPQAITMDMIQASAKHQVRTAAWRLAVAIANVITGLAWFLTTFDGRISLAGYTAAAIIAYRVVAAGVANYSNARIRWQSLAGAPRL